MVWIRQEKIHFGATTVQNPSRKYCLFSGSCWLPWGAGNPSSLRQSNLFGSRSENTRSFKSVDTLKRLTQRLKDSSKEMKFCSYPYAESVKKIDYRKIHSAAARSIPTSLILLSSTERRKHSRSVAHIAAAFIHCHFQGGFDSYPGSVNWIETRSG